MPKSSFTKKSRKTYRCNNCNEMFRNANSWKEHVIQSEACKSSHYPCIHCDKQYVGYEEGHLRIHYNQSTFGCKNLAESHKATCGFLPTLYKSNRTDDGNCSISSASDTDMVAFEPDNTDMKMPSSYNNDIEPVFFQQVDPQGSTSYVELTVTDDTLQSIQQLSRNIAHPIQSNLDTYIQSSRSVAGLNANVGNDRILTDVIDDIADDLASLNLSFGHHDDDHESLSSAGSESQNGSDSSSNSQLLSTRTINDQNAIGNHNVPPTNPTPTIGVHDDAFNLRERQANISCRFKDATFGPADLVMIDLFLILKASNAPMILFNRLIEWTRTHQSSLQGNCSNLLQSRAKFISNMNNTLFLGGVMMKPRIDRIQMSSGRWTSVVTFSLEEMVLRMLTNTSLFRDENLVLDPNDIFAPPKESKYYRDIHDGSWWKEAIKNMCLENDQILMPFIYFIDGLKIDKFGKLTVEAVLQCCAWFNRHARNRSGTWWVGGFVQDQTLFRDQENYIRDDKAGDYHDMLSHIFADMKRIQEAGGMKITLNLGGKIHHVRAIPVIAFVIGDCKGNDLLCGRMGGHHIGMQGLCRDCTISPLDGDNPCVGEPLLCEFITRDHVIGKSKEELATLSFLPLTNNCFNNLSFGGDHRGIWGACPAEILHAVELGLCEYIAESLDLFFTQASLDIISSAVACIVKNSRRQSERDVPDLNPFREGLTSVASLKARERFARVYALYLALRNDHVIAALCTKKRKKKKGDTTPTSHITPSFISGYANVIEDTLCFHQWLKQDQFLKADFVVPEGECDSRASSRIKKYLHDFKTKIKRSGNGFKTPKFHQMLHLVDYIIRFGPPASFDGSRGENFGKVIIKDNAKKTNRHKDTLNFDIATRISEDDIVDQASQVFFMNKKRWPSKFCTEKDLQDSSFVVTGNNNRTTALTNAVTESIVHATKPRFLIVPDTDFDESYQDDEGTPLSLYIDWGSIASTPYVNFESSLIQKVGARLFLNCPHHGGRVLPTSPVSGYTVIKKDGHLYRAHPWYAKKGPWFDWAYFEWSGYEQPIPALIKMFVDLTNAEITYEDEPDHDDDVANNRIAIPHLSNDVWAIVQPAIGIPEPMPNSNLTRKIEIDNNLFMVPTSSLVGPACVIETPNYPENDFFVGSRPNRTGIVVEPMRKWPDVFLKPEDSPS